MASPRGACTARARDEVHAPNPAPPPVVLPPQTAEQGATSSPFSRRSSRSRDVLSSSSLPLRRPCRHHTGPVARRRLSQSTPRVLRAVRTRLHLCASALRSCASLFLLFSSFPCDASRMAPLGVRTSWEVPGAKRTAACVAVFVLRWCTMLIGDLWACSTTGMAKSASEHGRSRRGDMSASSASHHDEAIMASRRACIFRARRSHFLSALHV